MGKEIKMKIEELRKMIREQINQSLRGGIEKLRLKGDIDEADGEQAKKAAEKEKAHNEKEKIDNEREKLALDKDKFKDAKSTADDTERDRAEKEKESDEKEKEADEKESEEGKPPEKKPEEDTNISFKTQGKYYMTALASLDNLVTADGELSDNEKEYIALAVQAAEGRMDNNFLKYLTKGKAGNVKGKDFTTQDIKIIVKYLKQNELVR